jgi:hypothetical protein
VTDSRLPAPLEWIFRDRRTGRITIAQFPNVALWIFLATVVLRRIGPTHGAVRTTIGAVGVAALAWWAVDEVLRGVNPFRRLLGLAGCGLAIAGLISLVR